MSTKSKAMAAAPQPTSNNTTAMVSADTMGALAQYQESFTRDDVQLPFIRILQDNSPQVKKQDAAYIKGAEAGLLFNTATGELYDAQEKGLLVVPVKYTRSITEWIPRSQGGGFVADHGPNLELLNSAEKIENAEGAVRLTLPNGHELVDSALYYVLVLREDEDGEIVGVEQAAITMSGMSWKAARQWNTKASMLVLTTPDGQKLRNPPLFVAAWRLFAEYTKNEKGTFFKFKAPLFHKWTHEVGEEILQTALALREGIEGGAVRTQAPAGADDDIPGF